MQPPGDAHAALRRLPKVDEVLGSPMMQELLQKAPRWAVVTAVRSEIDRLRRRILDGNVSENQARDEEIDVAAVSANVDRLTRASLRPVINATGVVLHTNLGRAPLATAAIERITTTARGYNNLEYVLDQKQRGSRHDHVRSLLCQLTGAEEALVVNNCAAAVLLALSGLASGKNVVVSRGELVEIGGSFRVPDVMRQSGARLVEVGTTNRTHLRDYRVEDAALLLKVHRSNFALIGFTHDVSVAELRTLGKPVMVDLGSGALVDLHLGEPTVQTLIAEGADVVTFSGDKLLGGPQAGMLVGKKAAIEPLRTHPLLRALRPDKLTLAALEATLEIYRDGSATTEIPALAMLTATEPMLQARAEKLCSSCAAARPDLHFGTMRVRSAVGGGSLPLCEPWSWAVTIEGKADQIGEPSGARRGASPEAVPRGLPDQIGEPSGARRGASPEAVPRGLPDKIETALRKREIVARIADDRLLLDVRTLMDGDLEKVAHAFKEITFD
jgi:L-seryl-tRNA(Ser) seleniumtransferase